MSRENYRLPLGRGSLRIMLGPKQRIRVSRGEGRSESKNKTGLMPVDDRPRDYLIPSKKAGINFYDTGLKKVGDVWTNHVSDLIISPPIALVGGSIDIPAATEEEISEMMADIETAVFAVSLENWASNFYKIAKGNADYEKSITVAFERNGTPVEANLTELPEWKSGGLLLSQSQVESLVIGPDWALYREGFALSGDDVKFTLTNSYSADAVAFNPSTRMDIFLMPGIIFNSGVAQYFNGFVSYPGPPPGSDVIYYLDVLNNNYNVLHRDLLAQRYLIHPSGITSYQLNYRVWTLIKQLHGARAKRIKTEMQNNPPTYPYSTIMTDLAANDFPFSAIYTNTVEPTMGTHQQNQTNGADFGSVEATDSRRLVALIRKGGVWYYMWNNGGL